MSAFQEIVKFFNSKKSNKIFTRAEYFTHMYYKSSYIIKDAYLDTVRCYLQRAKYLTDQEAGVYRKLKPIPKDITLTKLQEEAYPGTTDRRNKQNKAYREYDRRQR